MSEGPTTAGSIVAKLSWDKSEWDRQRAEIKVESAEIGRLSPRIHVDTNAAEVVGELGAVDVATHEVDDSTKSLNATNQGGIQRWQLIAGAIAALIPLLAPLAGYAVGVAGALAGMGAAGVLAVFGVIAAMKQGTAVGKEYSAGMKQLKADFNELSSTSAIALLASFKQGIALINSALPTLNAQIKTFAQLLGPTANIVLQAVITAFTVMNPLFVQASVYVQELANGFLQWTQDGGLQQFVNYAMTNFPQVAETLGHLVTGVMNLVSALAPLGGVILTVLEVFGDVLANLPVNVLLELASGAAAAFIAFQVWGALTPIIESVAVGIGAVAAATDLALGPIGLIVAGVGALVGVMGASLMVTQQNTAAIGQYSAAIDEDTGVLGKNTRAQVAKQLSDAGAYQAALKLGISQKDLTDAVLQGGSALQAIDAKVKKAADSYGGFGNESARVTAAQKETRTAVDTLRGTLDSQSSAIKKAVQNYNDMQAAMGGVAGTAKMTTAQIKALNAAIAQVQRNVTITMRVNQVGVQSVSNLGGNKQAFADGGTVGGSGGPKSDSVNAWLSVGEEVTPNPQAGRYRPVLKALAADNVPAAAAALGGRGSSVTNNFTIYEATNGAQLAQQVANRQNALTV